MIVLAYAIVFLCGLLSGYALGLSARPATLGGMPTSTVRSTWLNFWPILLVVAALVVVGVFTMKVATDRAVDQEAADRVADSRAQFACIAEWGADVVDTTQARNAESLRLEAAEARRDRSFDDVIRISAQLRRIPPRAVDSDLADALFRANRARINLSEVRGEVAQSRANQTYPISPELTCSPGALSSN